MTEVQFVMEGKYYESIKATFKKLRETKNFISVRSNREQHVWLVEEQSISAEYDHDYDSGNLQQARVKWNGNTMTPLLLELLKIFVGGQPNVEGKENGTNIQPVEG